MHRVVFEHMNPMRGVELKNQLESAGLINHQDFEWEYRASKWDGFSAATPKKVIFEFRDAALATFYQLKWK